MEKMPAAWEIRVETTPMITGMNSFPMVPAMECMFIAWSMRSGHAWISTICAIGFRAPSPNPAKVKAIKAIGTDEEKDMTVKLTATKPVNIPMMLQLCFDVMKQGINSNLLPVMPT